MIPAPGDPAHLELHLRPVERRRHVPHRRKRIRPCRLAPADLPARGRVLPVAPPPPADPPTSPVWSIFAGPFPARRRALMLTRLVRTQLVDLHHRVGDRHGRNDFRLHAGADMARHRATSRSPSSCRRRAGCTGSATSRTGACRSARSPASSRPRPARRRYSSCRFTEDTGRRAGQRAQCVGRR